MGKYNTVPGKMIYDIMICNRDRALSAAEVHKCLSDDGQTVNLTTVYRVLERLEEKGQVVKCASEDGKRAKYRVSLEDKCCHDHLHLQCSVCGKVTHLDCDYMDGVAKHIRESHGFALNTEKCVLYGVCGNCEVDNNR